MNASYRGLVAGGLALLLAGPAPAGAPPAAAPPAGAPPAGAPQTLTLAQSLDLALQQNLDVLKAQQELRRTHGLIVQARAALLPQLTASGSYRQVDKNKIDVPAIPGFAPVPGLTSVSSNQEQPWAAQVEISQLLWSGGRASGNLRVARLSDQIAVLGFQQTVADTILAVRKAFYQILLDQVQVTVREQSVTLLEQQLADAQHRYEAGTVPQFNVLRAQVELANAKPPLIRAQNDLRLARETLVKLLAIDTPEQHHGFTTIRFSGELRYAPRDWQLTEALAAAVAHRPELQQADRQVAISKENAKIARAGYHPELSVFGNYGAQDTMFADDPGNTVHGWTAGARVTWPLFDGLLTRGKIEQATAQLEQARLSLDDARRRIELEVRQAYSDYLQARQLIAAQQQTVAQATESLRLGEARFRAGTGTQLDVLSAQTALTDARSNEIQALYDYNVAVDTLERVTGATVK